MANPIPFPLPDRPDEFQLDRQWAENYIPAFKYGARLDSSQVVGGNITVEDTGIPVGVFDTLDFVGATITDNGDGSVTIEVTNWTNFFNDIDWSQNTDWDSFVTSVITNWTATNWDNFIDTFITNVDSDDVFNFLNQISGSTKGDILVYDGATWTSLPAGADGLFLQANSVTATGLAYAAGGGGAPLTIQEEGVNVETATTQINFIGAGATATNAGVGLVDVTIPGYSLEVEDEGISVDADVVNIDFVGTGVTTTQTAPGNVEVSIPSITSFTGPLIPGFNPSGDYVGNLYMYDDPIFSPGAGTYFIAAHYLYLDTGDYLFGRSALLEGFPLFSRSTATPENLEFSSGKKYAISGTFEWRDAGVTGGRFGIGFKAPSAPAGRLGDAIELRVNSAIDTPGIMAIGKAANDSNLYLYVNDGVVNTLTSILTIPAGTNSTRYQVTMIVDPVGNTVTVDVNGTQVVVNDPFVGAEQILFGSGNDTAGGSLVSQSSLVFNYEL
ncbi:MAG: hypothetical protein ACW99U_21995 [Candidatus Thorarchaeota archaeon]|jgi:hypothetical protein